MFEEARGVGVSLDAEVGVPERGHGLAEGVEDEERARHDLVAVRREVDLDLLVDDRPVRRGRGLGGDLRLLHGPPVAVVAAHRHRRGGQHERQHQQHLLHHSAPGNAAGLQHANAAALH
jgi:hypothetical protein